MSYQWTGKLYFSLFSYARLIHWNTSASYKPVNSARFQFANSRTRLLKNKKALKLKGYKTNFKFTKKIELP